MSSFINWWCSILGDTINASNTSEPHVYAPSQGFNNTVKATIKSVMLTKTWFQTTAKTDSKHKIKHWPAGVGTHAPPQPDRQESLVRKTWPWAAHDIKIISTSSTTVFFRTVYKSTIHRTLQWPHLNMFNKNTLVTACICNVLPLPSSHTAELSLFYAGSKNPTRRPSGL